MEMLLNLLSEIWHAMQMIFIYGIAGLLILFVIYFFYRLEQEVAKDKEKGNN